MKRNIKKVLITLLASVVFVTSVYAGVAFSDNPDGMNNADTVLQPDELLKEYSGAYENITYGTNLYVWSGDKSFKAENYLPDGLLDEQERIEHCDGKIDLTPGAVSPVVYKITSKEEKIRYELYVFTAVSRKESATVQSKEYSHIVYGLKKSENFSGHVPYDYTKTGETYVSENEIDIVKGSRYYPQFSFLNYDSDLYVVEICNGNLDTSKAGSYNLTYNVSPVNDPDMQWQEKYTVNVLSDESVNKGIKVTAVDNTIHATVHDRNNCDTEVYMGKDYNLNAGINQITVQNRRGYEAYADVEIIKNGKKVSSDELIKSVVSKKDNYIIYLKDIHDSNNKYEIRLSNKRILNELLSKKKYVVGGWNSHNSDNIIVDKYKNTTKKTYISSIYGYLKGLFSVDVKAAVSNVKQWSVKNLMSGNPIPNHYADEYSGGRPTGRKVVDGVRIDFTKKDLINSINDAIEDEGLTLTNTDSVPASLNLYCADHGAAGYYTTQMSKSFVTYVNAYLKKDGNTYYVVITAQFHGSGRQRLEGTSPKIAVAPNPAYLKIEKKTDTGSGTYNGVVKGAKYAVYAKKSNAEKKKNALFVLTTNDKGNATVTASQAKQLKSDKTYYIRETSAPTGTKLNTKIYSVKTSASGKAVKLSTVNQAWKIKVNIHKTSSTNNANLPGAEFTIYQWNGEKYTKYKTLITGSNGTVSTDWLYYTKTNQGKWRIIETKPPAGYKKDSAQKDYQIKAGNTDSTLTYDKKNTPEQYYGYISIQKTMSSGHNNRDYNMSAAFTIYKDSACTQMAGTIQTNANGYGKSGELPVAQSGTVYWVKETSCGAGMDAVNKNAEQIKVNPKAVTHVSHKSNESALGVQTPWFAGLSAKKVSIVSDSKTLSGAEFTFYEWNGQAYRAVATRKTDAGGIAKIDVTEKILKYTNINKGKFAVKETKAPDGYELNDTSMHYITLTAENKGKTIDAGIWRNTPWGWFDITKVIVDALGRKETSHDFSSKTLGITYGLYADKACTEPVAGYSNIILDKTGHFKSEAIKPGKYYLRENTFNTQFFSNRTGLTVELIVYPDTVTYLNGEKGLSYDGVTWEEKIW